MASSRLSSLVALVLGAIVVTDLLAQKPVPRQRLIAIVVQDLADDKPIPATMVKIVDRGGKVLADGLTDADGRYSTSVGALEAFAVQFERIGYLRRPETMTLATHAPGSSPLRGRLLRSSGSESYYRQVGSAIERHALGGSEPGWDISREMDRATELPAASRAAIESGLSAGARAELTAAREEIRTASKTIGNQLDGPFSASPALGNFKGWLGVGTAGFTADTMRTIVEGLMNAQEDLKTQKFAPSSIPHRRAYERLLEEATSPEASPTPKGRSQCVTPAGSCPMLKPEADATSCFCYTPYGPQYGLVR